MCGRNASTGSPARSMWHRRFSVSLNAPDAETYARICPNRYGAASFPALLDFLREAPKHIPSVVATAVALPGLDHEAVRRLAESIPGVSFRLRPYDNVG